MSHERLPKAMTMKVVLIAGNVKNTDKAARSNTAILVWNMMHDCMTPWIADHTEAETSTCMLRMTSGTSEVDLNAEGK